jgi:hypothetical protein
MAGLELAWATFWSCPSSTEREKEPQIFSVSRHEAHAVDVGHELRRAVLAEMTGMPLVFFLIMEQKFQPLHQIKVDVHAGRHAEHPPHGLHVGVPPHSPACDVNQSSAKDSW